MTAQDMHDNETNSTEETVEESVKPSFWTRSKKYVIGGIVGAGLLAIAALAAAPVLAKNESEEDIIDLDPLEELPVIEATTSDA